MISQISVPENEDYLDFNPLQYIINHVNFLENNCYFLKLEMESKDRLTARAANQPEEVQEFIKAESLLSVIFKPGRQ